LAPGGRRLGTGPGALATGGAGGLLADRADDIPPLLDRLAALGWDWVIRVKARSTLVWRDDDSTEQPLRDLINATLCGPGTRLRATGRNLQEGRLAGRAPGR
jgi:hypothetical protein